MAFGTGVGDIVEGVRLAVNLYRYGFDEENSSKARYAIFRNDINNFSYLLEQLDIALNHAQERWKNRGPTLGSPAYEPLGVGIENERRILIGDFNATLRECQALLNKNKDVRRRYSNVPQNLKYHLLRQEERVDDLRRRLRFHCEKIRFVVDRLSVNYLTDMDAKMDDLQATADETLYEVRSLRAVTTEFRTSLFGYLDGTRGLPSLPPIDPHIGSDAIRQKFTDSFLVNAPNGIEVGIPIKEGFDALLSWFEQATDASEETPEKYLLFLKARWLLERLKASVAYENARPGYYYKRATNQIGHAIAARIHQPGKLVPYDENVLMACDISCFVIWPPRPRPTEETWTQPSNLLKRANEVEVAHLEGSTGTFSPITIFQRADDRFRIVQAVTPDSEQGIPVNVSCDKDRLIPRYAIPTLSDPPLEIAIYSQANEDEEIYQFDCIKDMHAFQASLTGYEISHEQVGVLCQFSEGLATLDCTGRIQFWQEPVPQVTSEDNVADNHSAGLAASSRSTGSKSRYDSLVPSIVSTNTVRETSDGWQADRIKHSALVIFTELREKERARFATIFVDLGQAIYINKDDCRCWKEYDRCSKLVLRTSGKNGFTVRVFCSGTTPNGQPDVNSFDAFPFRLPGHPKFACTAPKKTDFLVLKFGSLQAKKDFDDELKLRNDIRGIQTKNLANFEQWIRFRQDRPQHREAFVSQTASQTSVLPPRRSSSISTRFTAGTRDNSVESAGELVGRSLSGMIVEESEATSNGERSVLRCETATSRTKVKSERKRRWPLR